MATILIVDQDAARLDQLAAKIADAGHTPLKAVTLPEATSMLEAAPAPDLVLLDVPHTPPDSRAWLAAHAATVPIMVLSSMSREEDVVAGLDAGAVDYITRPYRSSELMARTRRHLALATAYPSNAPAATTPPSAPVETPPPATPQNDLPPVALVRAEQPAAAPTTAPDDAATTNDDDGAVFISPAEEQALLVPDPAAPAPPPAAATGDDANLSLGQRFYRARQNRRITLVQAENELHQRGLRMWQLQALEAENFTSLPRGKPTEEAIRTYADYLGLPADSIVEHYKQHHKHDPAAPTASPITRAQSVETAPPRWSLWGAAVLLALVVSGVVLYLLDPTGVTALGESLQDVFWQ